MLKLIMKKLKCHFTDGHALFAENFYAFTSYGALKKAASFQEAKGWTCLSMKFA